MKKLILALTFILTFILAAFSISSVYVEEAFDFKEFEYEDLILPYRIYVPEDYSADNDYPLVVFLHGAGERGVNNDLQLNNAMQTLFDRRDGLMLQSIVIAPQCPENEQWVDTPWADGNYSTDEVPESDELAAVVALTKALCGEYSIDTARIYAMGISMGGFGAWDLIIRHNDLFAGAAPMCGGGDPSKAALLVDTPIYTFHGTNDASVPFAGTEEMVSAIEDEGGRLINFIVYDGEGHGIWENAADEEDWCEWLFEHKLTDRYPELAEETADTSASIEETESTDTDTDEAAESEEITAEEEKNTDTASVSEKKESSFPVGVIVVFVAVIIAAAAVVVAISLKRKK